MNDNIKRYAPMMGEKAGWYVTEKGTLTRVKGPVSYQQAVTLSNIKNDQQEKAEYTSAMRIKESVEAASAALTLAVEYELATKYPFLVYPNVHGNGWAK